MNLLGGYQKRNICFSKVYSLPFSAFAKSGILRSTFQTKVRTKSVMNPGLHKNAVSLTFALLPEFKFLSTNLT